MPHLTVGSWRVNFLGERVLVHDVQRGRGDDVWGLVSAQ